MPMMALAARLTHAVFECICELQERKVRSFIRLDVTLERFALFGHDLENLVLMPADQFNQSLVTVLNLCEKIELRVCNKC